MPDPTMQTTTELAERSQRLLDDSLSNDFSHQEREIAAGAAQASALLLLCHQVERTNGLVAQLLRELSARGTVRT